MLHLDPADAYGGAFGAFAESPGGVGWDVPSSADLERRAAMRDGLASDENFFADENVEHAELRFPALGAPVDARARLGAKTRRLRRPGGGTRASSSRVDGRVLAGLARIG